MGKKTFRDFFSPLEVKSHMGPQITSDDCPMLMRKKTHDVIESNNDHLSMMS